MPPSRIDQNDSFRIQPFRKTAKPIKKQEQPQPLDGRQLRVVDPNIVRQLPLQQCRPADQPQVSVRHHLPFKHEFPQQVLDLRTPTRKLKPVPTTPLCSQAGDQPSRLIPCSDKTRSDQHDHDQQTQHPSGEEHQPDQQQQLELEHFVAQLPPQVQPRLDGLVSEIEKKCLVCSKKFPTVRNLKRHVRSVHFSEKNFECSYCDAQFYDKANLVRHLKLLHKIRNLTSNRLGKNAGGKNETKKLLPEVKPTFVAPDAAGPARISSSGTSKSTTQTDKSSPALAVQPKLPDSDPKIPDGFNFSLDSEKFLLDNSEMLTSVMESSNVAGDLENFLASELGLPTISVSPGLALRKTPCTPRESSTPKRTRLESCEEEQKIKASGKSHFNIEGHSNV